MKKCENCNHARYSPSGRVACAILNDPAELAVLTGIPAYQLEEPAIRNQAVLKLMPASTPVYSGWAHPHRRHGDQVGGGVGQGIMWNDCLLLDKDSSCPRWAEIK